MRKASRLEGRKRTGVAVHYLDRSAVCCQCDCMDTYVFVDEIGAARARECATLLVLFKPASCFLCGNGGL